MFVVKQYCMCSKDCELADHFLLHFDVVCILWSMVFSVWGVQWVMPSSAVELVVVLKGYESLREVVRYQTQFLTAYCG